MVGRFLTIGCFVCIYELSTSRTIVGCESGKWFPLTRANNAKSRITNLSKGWFGWSDQETDEFCVDALFKQSLSELLTVCEVTAAHDRVCIRRDLVDDRREVGCAGVVAFVQQDLITFICSISLQCRCHIG